MLASWLFQQGTSTVLAVIQGFVIAIAVYYFFERVLPREREAIQAGYKAQAEIYSETTKYLTDSFRESLREARQGRP